MQTIQYSKLFLAIAVVACFSAVGVGIALRSLPFIFIATFLGFGIMAYGIVQKRKDR
ncbi:hypothetical protein GGQ92_000082 [Gracilibacillus halotolerans]|uniref:Uncharacterized protein n=1 Tax=Gracilibacillus halotolerans TaxID=74386 RepID=A0A841RJE6_9BACI|nr:DUF5325 family protein [Gracilibacillus halotolerans]MBB6511315.1 hypothetical protein [Gracilibacillus halotolerans]